MISEKKIKAKTFCVIKQLCFKTKQQNIWPAKYENIL